MLRPAAVLLAAACLGIPGSIAEDAPTPATPGAIEELLRAAKEAFRAGRLAEADSAFSRAYRWAADARAQADTISAAPAGEERALFESLQRAALQGLAVIRLDALEREQQRLRARLAGLAGEVDAGDPRALWVAMRGVRAAVDSTVAAAAEISAASRPLALSVQGASGDRLARFLVESERLRTTVREYFVTARIRIYADLESRLRLAATEDSLGPRRSAIEEVLSDLESILAEPVLESDFREAIEALAGEARATLEQSGGASPGR